MISFTTESISQLAKFSSFDSSKFQNFDFYFIGEQHKKDFEKIEVEFLKKIDLSNAHILFEAPYDVNYSLKKIFDNRDTLSEKLTSLTKNGYKNKLLNYIYTQGVTVNSINLYTSLKSFPKTFLLSFYDSLNISDSSLLKDLNLLRQIGSFCIKPRDMAKSDLFFESFEKNIDLHKEILLDNFNYINGCINTLKARIELYNDTTKNSNSIISNIRENFMFERLKDFVAISNKNKIISFNGILHISLTNSDNYGVVSWESLAFKTKIHFENKKVCSVYILKLESDNFFKHKYSEAFDYLIKQEFESNCTYILDLETTNFERLKKEYQFILIFR